MPSTLVHGWEEGDGGASSTGSSVCLKACGKERAQKDALHFHTRHCVVTPSHVCNARTTIIVSLPCFVRRAASLVYVSKPA